MVTESSKTRAGKYLKRLSLKTEMSHFLIASVPHPLGSHWGTVDEQIPCFGKAEEHLLLEAGFCPLLPRAL